MYKYIQMVNFGFIVMVLLKQSKISQNDNTKFLKQYSLFKKSQHFLLTLTIELYGLQTYGSYLDTIQMWPALAKQGTSSMRHSTGFRA